MGACIAANKVAGVGAYLIHETFSAYQGVEEDDLNLICLGGLVVGQGLAWEWVQTFLAARIGGAWGLAVGWRKLRNRKQAEWAVALTRNIDWAL